MRYMMLIVILAAMSVGFAPRAIGEPSSVSSPLVQAISALGDAFTLIVEVDRPAHILMPGQGIATYEMRVTVSPGVTAIVWKRIQLPAARYYAPGTPGYQPGDYDEDGNLIVSMQSDGAVIRDGATHEEYVESAAYFVGPDNTIKRQTVGTTLVVNRPSETNTVPLNLLRRIMFALGRPWASGLTNALSEELLEGGMIRLRVQGGWAPSQGPVVSEVIVDSANGFLAREARFGIEDETRQATSKSDGIRKFGRITWADRGEFALASQKTSTRLMSFSPSFDERIVKDAENIIARANSRLVRVIDHRDSIDQPTIRMVPAGELKR